MISRMPVSQTNKKYGFFVIRKLDNIDQHRIPVPIAMNVPNVPPPCTITFPTLLINSLPLKPNRKQLKPPNIAPEAMPTHIPIINPILTRSKQDGPCPP